MRKLVGAIAAVAALSAVWSSNAYADPAQDTITRLKDLSQRAQQLTESIQAAKADLDIKLQVLAQADAKHSADLAALDAADAELATRQSAVDKVAAAAYMGGSSGDVATILTATSPKALIEEMSVHRVVAAEMAAQLGSFRQTSQRAQAIAAESAASAADAKAAVDAAVAVRTDLLDKQTKLRAEVGAASADYAALPASQRAELGSPATSVLVALGLVPPIPTVGMRGLVPNARGLAFYIMATYPGVTSIGGVRSDPLPDHPSGHAIDIMIGGNMGLGDAINADVQNQAARFGVRYTMWRVAHHFDHVHVTVN